MVAQATEGAQQTPEFKPAPSEISPPDDKPYHLMVSQNCSYIYSSNVELRTFPDKESHIFMHRLEESRDKNVQILHRCYPKQDSSLLQLFIMGKTVGAIASRTEAIIPYLPYARQDKIWKPGEVLSAEIVVQMLAASGFSSIATFDCHFLKKAGVFDYAGIKIRNFSLNEELVNYFRARKPDAMFISPDQGASYIVDYVGGKSMKKTRGDYKNSKRTAVREIAKLEILSLIHI